MGSDIFSAIQTTMTCIDICVFMIVMYMSTTDARGALLTQRKKTKKRSGEDVYGSTSRHAAWLDDDDDPFERIHVKQIQDLILWHIGVMDTRWYVKPRSTCWFEEYLFNIYTPDMFYDILRMRRRTFDRLVRDLRPYI